MQQHDTSEVEGYGIGDINWNACQPRPALYGASQSLPFVGPHLEGFCVELPGCCPLIEAGLSDKLLCFDI